MRSVSESTRLRPIHALLFCHVVQPIDLSVIFPLFYFIYTLLTFFYDTGTVNHSPKTLSDFYLIFAFVLVLCVLPMRIMAAACLPCKLRISTRSVTLQPICHLTPVALYCV